MAAAAAVGALAAAASCDGSSGLVLWRQVFPDAGPDVAYVPDPDTGAADAAPEPMDAGRLDAAAPGADAGPLDVGQDGGAPDSSGADAGAADAAPDRSSWGAWAASQGLADCPAAPVLTVDTALDELDVGTALADPSQAGPTLSLAEALWIAANRPGPDTLAFDPAVFPAAQPATITVTGAHLLPSAPLTDTCVDARGRGVQVQWPASLQGASGYLWNLGAGSRQMGLVLDGLPFQQGVGAGAVLAACRLRTEPVGGRDWLVELQGGVVGPGNAFTGARALRGLGGQGTVRGNWFGVDPLTGLGLPLSVGVHLQTGGAVADVVTDNVFGAVTALLTEAGTRVAFQRNLVGLDPAGRLFPGAGPALELVGTPASQSTCVIGPGNVIWGQGTAVDINGAQVQVTGNSIFGNAAGIVYQGAAPVPPPAVVAVEVSGLRGTCPMGGTVEAFGDKGGQGELFLGSAACAAGVWTLVASVPSGYKVTATLTDGAGHTSAFSPPFPP